jgi:hypothetical protein
MASKTNSGANGDSGDYDDEMFKQLLDGDTECVKRCLETTRDNLQHIDDPYPMGLIIDTRSPFGLHLVIDMELAGKGLSSGFEAEAVINKLRAKGGYQSALEKAVATLLAENEAKTKAGEIPISFGITNRLSWEARLRDYAAKVDDYYRDNLDGIVAMFKQLESVLRSDQYPVAIIEPYQTAYLTVTAPAKKPQRPTTSPWESGSKKMGNRLRR